MTTQPVSNVTFPYIASVGFDGLVVRFSDQLSDAANRAALAFCNEVQGTDLPALTEVSTALCSTLITYDPLRVAPEDMLRTISDILAQQDWYAAPLPAGRKLWTIPTVFGGEFGPQLGDVAQLVGLSDSATIEALCAQRVRVQTIGFAPGMPYLGPLPDLWNIPRQQNLNPHVPAGGLCIAVGQMVLFPVDTQTGWRHIGQTAFPLFAPQSETPFLLNAGDELQFAPIDATEYTAIKYLPLGGARGEDLA